MLTNLVSDHCATEIYLPKSAVRPIHASAYPTAQEVVQFLTLPIRTRQSPSYRKRNFNADFNTIKVDYLLVCSDKIYFSKHHHIRSIAILSFQLHYDINLRFTDEIFVHIPCFLVSDPKRIDLFCTPILFAISTSKFSKLCKKTYAMACSRVLSSAAL
jgi:hypothetical protein